jgi:AcrR family transcriptional regulator
VTASAPLRRDTRATREALLDAAGALLAERGTTFGLPELARRAAVSTATAYRHFTAVQDVHQAFYLRLAEDLVRQLDAAGGRGRGVHRFQAVCQTWARAALSWGPAAVHIRSPRGYLHRLRDGDVLVGALHRTLAPVVAQLVDDGAIRPQQVDYAVLLWITIFDERVVLDLHDSLGWPARRIGTELGRSVLAALGG